MSILTKYLLRLHFVPFVFALSAITGIMLVNQIAKRLRDLVGKGLPWHVIADVFTLSLPFIVAMTLPMAVLVAVLYTVSRLTVDSELTAMRAGGISLGRVVRPLLVASIAVSGLAFLFSDQVLPRSNHRLRTLLSDIARTKPTFGIEEQVINEVKRSRVFLRAGQVDAGTFTLRDVTIVDLSDNNRKRVTYADSAHMAFAPNEEDLVLTLFDGVMHETDRVDASNFQTADFNRDRVRVEGVAGNFTRTLNDNYRGDREMGVCEMDSVIVDARRERWISERRADAVELNSLRAEMGLAAIPQDTIPPEDRPHVYCRVLEWVMARGHPEDLAAQVLGAAQVRDSVGATQSSDDDVRSSVEPATNALVRRVSSGNLHQEVTAGTSPPPPRIQSARVLRDRAESAELRAAQYGVEVHKKYAIAAACIVFVLVGVPAAIKFPRGGIGLVVGASLIIFTVYYVGLIGGESLANKRVVSPFWAMWTPNLIFATVGVIALWYIRTEATAGRGEGGFWPLTLFRRR